MVVLPAYETELTHDLALEVAKKSKGVCLLMFSGKDSIAAWLQVKRYFSRVVAFHCASYPRLKCEQRWLDYYEDALCDKDRGDCLIRLVGEELPMGLVRGMYQTFDGVPFLEEVELADFSKLDVCEMIRKEFNLPRAWCAVGLSVGDSIDRRIYIKKVGGKNPNNLTWYPLADWDRSEILKALRESGLKLPDSYRYSCRSLSGVPSYTWLKILREHYPEDYERVLSMFPLAEAKTYREKMLDAIWERRKSEGIVSEDDEADPDGGVAGSDVMQDVMADVGDEDGGE